MNIILQVLSLLFVVMWTAKLARNKGRSPLVWGGVAAIPALGLLDIFPEWITVLCMLPMLALVFMPARRPVATDGGQDGTTPCPRCQHSHEARPTFCTNCGWEMARPCHDGCHHNGDRRERIRDSSNGRASGRNRRRR